MQSSLTAVEIEEVLKSLPEWRFDKGRLVREWIFDDFISAIAFVNRVAAVAEGAGHHPDIEIRYNRVLLGLVSHDAGGVTKRDEAMAAQISHQFPTG
jgi:4a-hydroxytetrahydrobiopterin dehydratase